MSPEDHDAALAEVSHLPHAVAAALVHMPEPESLRLCGNGFLDATRIAGGDGGLWRDIFLDNADHVKAALAKLRQSLAEFEALLEPGKSEVLRAWLDSAAVKRETLVNERLKDQG